MTCKKFTYSGDPSKTPRDAVRFLIGDTIKERPMFSDDEVDYQLTQTPGQRIAGAELLEIKSRQWARLADFRVGDVSKSLSKAADAMRKAAKALRADSNKRALPFFGGLSKAGKLSLEADEDAVQPQFLLGMTDNIAVQMNRDINAVWSLVGPGVL